MKRMPKAKNGRKRKAVHVRAFGSQRSELHKRAREKGMSTNYYVNLRLWGIIDY